MSAPPILVLHASGTNRDIEAAAALELAGARPRIVHVNELRAGRARFSDHAALVVPGGFSYGDSLGAGARLALEMRHWFGSEIGAFVAEGRPVLGICNGFQALLRAGVLGGEGVPAATLTTNERGRFECRWVHIGVEPGCRSSWLSGLEAPIRCPVAHGEGRLAVTAPRDAEELSEMGLVALRYLDESGGPAGGRHPANPNGSIADIAGLCDPSGVAVGLMPHPEDHVVAWQSTRPGAGGSGLPLFEAFVAAAR